MESGGSGGFGLRVLFADAVFCLEAKKVANPQPRLLYLYLRLFEVRFLE